MVGLKVKGSSQSEYGGFGIAKEVPKIDKKLDDLIHGINETNVDRREDANELCRREKLLLDSGNQICNMAIARRRNVENAVNENEDGVVAHVGHEVIYDMSEGT